MIIGVHAASRPSADQLVRMISSAIANKKFEWARWARKDRRQPGVAESAAYCLYLRRDTDE